MTEPEKMKIIREKKRLTGTGKKVSNVTASKKKKAALKALADLEVSPEIYATFKENLNILYKMTNGDSACDAVVRKLSEDSMTMSRMTLRNEIGKTTTLEEIIECYDRLNLANELDAAANILSAKTIRACLQEIEPILKG